MIYTVTLNPALDRELTIEAFVFDDVLRASASRIDCGGKGFNVSRALQALGVESAALGFTGGSTGQHLAAALDEAGIHTDFVPISGETRTNTSIVTTAHGRYLKVNEAGPTISAAEAAALQHKVRELARPGDWWVLAGSLPPGLPADFYAALITIIQDAGAQAILDTSGEPLSHGISAGVYLSKPNRDEAAAILARQVETDRDLLDAVHALHNLGAVHVALSLGADGALLSDGTAIWQARPPTITERNPIGAGDALVAGLVWALSRGDSPSEALRWGVACGAAAASLDGTAMPDRTHVEQIQPQVGLRLR